MQRNRQRRMQHVAHWSRTSSIDTQSSNASNKQWPSPSKASNKLWLWRRCSSRLVKCRWKTLCSSNNRCNSSNPCNSGSIKIRDADKTVVDAATDVAVPEQHGNNRHGASQTQQHTYTTQPNINFNALHPGMARHGTQTANPYHVYKTPGYCSTHGGHVHDSHTSRTARRPAQATIPTERERTG